MKEGKSMYFNIEFPNKMAHAYSVMCKPLCQEMKLPQTAFDILMFLSNNPQYKTARDIVEVRKIKANLVSINVDKLVKDRRSPKDRTCMYFSGRFYYRKRTLSSENF